ncbi:MAG TPA: hypothetical protein VH684_14605 [Xanthobacteraceae bacterium]|jgi:bifunctional DNA-binding transcriptional regulator/antitoxin component of YhaV-PrlF toxin-antitoxin module
MPKVQVHGNQITLPDDLRSVLTNAADDAIEAEEVEEGILLKPSTAMRRAAGLADIRAAQSGVRYTGGTRPSPEQEERQIADILAADKDDTPHRDRDLAEEILEIGRRCAALPDVDRRTAEEIIGYDENGLPG